MRRFYFVVGDELVFKTSDGIKKVDLPFSPKARDGDFLFYSTESHSILQSPLTSVDDLIPANRLQDLNEFAFYPSCKSSLHLCNVLKEDGRTAEVFEKEMPFYNDAYGENIFTEIMKMG